MVSTKNFTFLDVKQGFLWTSIMLLISIISLGYIGIWGYSKQNIQAGYVVIIFGFLLTASLIVILGSILVGNFKSSSDDKFWLNNWTIPSTLFLVGFMIQSLIVKFSQSTQTQSFLSIQKNNLLATFSSNMPRFAEFFVTGLMVPIIEELFFLFFIPQCLVWVFDAIGFKVVFFKNKLFQLSSIIFVSGSLFAVFHVGQQGNTNFIIAALIFRTITIIAVWGDVFYDYFKYAVVGIAFTIGFHQGNNWTTYGFLNGLDILTSNVLGWGYIGLLFLMFTFGPLELLFRKLGWGQ